MISNYVSVVTVRVIEEAPAAAGAGWDPSSYQAGTPPEYIPGTNPPQFTAPGPPTGAPPSPASGAAGQTPSITFQNRPSSYIDAGKVLYYYPYFNLETNQYESNILEVYMAGAMQPVFIENTVVGFSALLYSTPVGGAGLFQETKQVK